MGRDTISWRPRLLSTLGPVLVATNSPHPVTLILRRTDLDPSQTTAELVPLLYDELRQIARALMLGRAPGETLQPTALVHEAYVKLLGADGQSWESRQHFFAAAARAMRNILVDAARRREALKRGGDRERVSIQDLPIDLGRDELGDDFLALESALERLERDDERRGRIVMLRFFAGLTEAETAEALGISRATVAREWVFIRHWLFREIKGR